MGFGAYQWEGEHTMTRYLVYVETDGDGRYMAHVPALPGCFARAAGRDEALRRAPDAIRETSAWLRRHGEPAPAVEAPIEIEIAGESSDGVGPFDPGGTAALLPPDLEPLTPEEMEHVFRLLAHSRADLLALVQDLPDEVLDWQPDPESFSIRRVLRHIGNAEEWYVSRLVAPESLPPEWEHDEDMPLFEFLEMERRTAIERLRRLTDEERAAVFHPTHRTDHPEEAWTARKALRRFLEHEREHIGQVREILAAWHYAHGMRIQTGPKQALLAGLDAARAELLAAAARIPPEERTSRQVCGYWTLKDVLGHVADWEWVGVEGLRQMAAGQPPQVEPIADLDAWNQAHYAARRDQPWDEVWADLHAARAALLETLEGMSQAALARSFPFWGSEGAAYQWVSVYIAHDREHACDLERV